MVLVLKNKDKLKIKYFLRTFMSQELVLQLILPTPLGMGTPIASHFRYGNILITHFVNLQSIPVTQERLKQGTAEASAEVSSLMLFMSQAVLLN